MFDIQRFCIHDGPGIRTVVFLKGCTLHCDWCQNPESILSDRQIAFYPERCSGCMECRIVCENNAIIEGDQRVDRKRCEVCGACTEICPNEALQEIGKAYSPKKLLDQVEADRHYYESGRGGVTLSGGEPFAQNKAVAEFLSLCSKSNIHTVVETSGAVPWQAIEESMPFVDLFYFDLKILDKTGNSNMTKQQVERVLDNAGKLVKAGANILFRMPVIPGHTDSKANLEKIADLLSELGQKTIALLPYHAGGISKIDRIASPLPKLNITKKETDQAIERVEHFFSKKGIEPQRVGAIKAGTKKDLFNSRVKDLRKAVQNANPSICLERAMLVTEYFKNRSNREKPMVIQKAQALAHVLKNKSATIYDRELLVGCFSSKRVGGSILPELHGISITEDLLSFSKRKVNPLHIDRSDIWKLSTQILPFWSTRFLAMKAFPTAKALSFVADQLKGKRYVINETGGISHFVPDYSTLLRLGTSGILENVRKREWALDLNEKERRNFYQAVRIVCDGLEAMAAKFAGLALKLAEHEPDDERKSELETIAVACERVPKYPAETLQQAFQSILFAQIALNNESLDNSVSPGRLDQVLFPYYEADRKAGRINIETARELVGCYTVKMCEIVPVFSKRITRYHGGMFNGQVVVVGGVDSNGEDATNDLTWLFLDAMDELRMRQPNYHVRLHSKSPKKLTERVAQTLRDGSGAPSIINDDLVVSMMEDRGMTKMHARDYSPVGCVEPVSCGRTFASTDAALVNLALCLEWVIGTKKSGVKTKAFYKCQSMEEILEQLTIQIDHMTRLVITDLQAIEQANAKFHPTPLTSSLIQGCIESGVDSTAGGALYNSSGIQGVGLVDLADSLAAIRDVVFERELATLKTLSTAIRKNFKGHEKLRGYLLQAPKFGNDFSVVDEYVQRLMKIFSKALGRSINTRKGPYLAGYYAVTTHKAFGETTGALPSGRVAGALLANGLSPTNGTDRLGPTAALNSVAKLDLRHNAQNGINVNLKLDQDSIGGNLGIEVLSDLIRGYNRAGGMQLQINVLDPNTLQEAMLNPESNPWLLVRVSGYSAYFNDLSPGMKQEIIERHLHKAG